MASSHSAVETGLAAAIALFNAGQRGPAEAQCRSLIAQHGAHPALLQLLAVLCQEHGDASAARQAITRSLAARPGHVPSLMIAALACQDLHDLPAAEALLGQVLQQQPGHVAAAVNLGVVHLAQGRLDEALRRFGLAYRLRPEALPRIAHALCADACGALWTDPGALRERLTSA